ncbi:MAG: hypothetical protein QNK37_33380 [Acidobacteriota bacterium]|nr:hypothetical protein [Acidobacteriota bacterium]
MSKRSPAASAEAVFSGDNQPRVTVRVSNSGGMAGHASEKPISSSLKSTWGAYNGKWNRPFGIRGLKIRNPALQIGATNVPPGITLGLSGQVDIAGTLDAKLAVLLDADEPILDIYSKSGLSLSRMIRVLTRVDDGNLLDADVENRSLVVYMHENKSPKKVNT